MNKLIQKLNKIPKGYFTFNDIKKISATREASLKVAINRLVKKGKLKRLIRGYYAVDSLRVDLEKFSIDIYKPSYLSFEWALAYYNILSQQSHAITLASIKRCKSYEINNTVIRYHQIQEKYFWGFKKINSILIAEPEKAFLDQIYLSLNGCVLFDVEEMDLKNLNIKKIKKYLKKFDNKGMDKKILKYL
ncbi:type IV toxin-antitoxin system AbiEi family antitoxin domain-containing protein [Candidatus Parcubacteria bacterium]|nr:type IV toxin-antitoxin system AbiEi family antitoxin domain-containing protein [Candidatus Parcubacteria bacterium]